MNPGDRAVRVVLTIRSTLLAMLGAFLLGLTCLPSSLAAGECSQALTRAKSTTRPDSLREGTVTNLKKVHCPFDQLVMRDKSELKQLAEVYKTAHRRRLAEAGYRILINIGDQESDLVGGFAEQTFKIPNAMYYIP